MNDNDFGSIRVAYGAPADEKLNSKLDVCATSLGGIFVSFEEEGDLCIREYNFIEEEQADDFMEQANFIISRYFPFESIDVEEFPYRAQWGFDEAVYHHVEFSEHETAQRFATWLRASFSTYLEIEMFDVFMINPIEKHGGFIVVYAFPFQSVLSDELLEENIDEVEDLLATVNVKKDKGGLLN